MHQGLLINIDNIRKIIARLNTTTDADLNINAENGSNWYMSTLTPNAISISIIPKNTGLIVFKTFAVLPVGVYFFLVMFPQSSWAAPNGQYHIQ